MASRYVFSVPIGPGKQPRLHQTLASLAAQPEPVRIAICHAGPEAEIAETLVPYRHIIAYERHGHDTGQSAAINEGWNALEGDVYGWLNADDALAPGALGAVSELFSQNPEADIVCGQSIILNEHAHFTGLHPAVRAPDQDLFRSNTISQPSCFVKRDALFAEGLVREDLHYVMDWDLWVRLMSSNRKFAYTPQILSSTLWDADTKTAKFNTARIKEIRQVVSRLNSPVTTAKTLIGHSLNKIEEYSALSSTFKRVRGLVESGSVRKSTYWGKEAQESVWTLDFFHYEALAKGIRFHFLSPAMRKIGIEASAPTESSEKIVEVSANLPPACIHKITLCRQDGSAPDLDYVELI
ncbi:MAG: glycosyltransferase [Alphaproteobacteria bacterium]|nr:glycosyltransferase [Alphaproteobacteria bacterium]|tara:strand:- start:617 stop:1675 length:1059 start_codon:yes stop_codon:yes gene_type:complete